MRFSADFETTTNPEDCRVWAYAITNVADTNFFTYGNSIDDFIRFMKAHYKDIFYFHNLKFDGEFIVHYLLSHGFTLNKEGKKLKHNEFSVLISDKGVWYSIKINFGTDKNNKYTEILDSLKILPFSVEQIAKTFNLPLSKLSIDYDEYREPGHKLTQEEIDYIHGDVTIVALALRQLFAQNLKQMTQGSNALHDYKNMFGKKNFERRFPVLDFFMIAIFVSLIRVALPTLIQNIKTLTLEKE